MATRHTSRGGTDLTCDGQRRIERSTERRRLETDMAWNPSPEVAIARDAAKAFGADMCVVLHLNTRTRQFGYASYGSTKSLCAEARQFGDRCYDIGMDWFAQKHPD